MRKLDTNYQHAKNILIQNQYNFKVTFQFFTNETWQLHNG